MAPDLSIIVPAFNEEASLAAAVTGLVQTAARARARVEIVIVDDGSVDRTGPIAETLSQTLGGVRVVHHEANQGWGQAVRTGLASAKHELVALCPVDNPLTAEQIETFLGAMGDADIVIGYRQGRAGYPRWLALASQCYYRLVRLLFGLRFRDVNWIHFYRRTAIESLDLRLSGIVFPAEVLVKAQRRGYRIVEVYSDMKPRVTGRPTVSRPRVMLRALRDLGRLWLEIHAGDRSGRGRRDG